MLGRAADSPFGGDLEAVALAIPTDALGGPPPPRADRPGVGARASFDAVGARRWAAAASWVDAMAAAWKRAGERRPQAAGRPDDPALDALIRAVAARDPARARQAALQVEQAALDLQLRHRPPAQVDLDRMDLWARQLLVDAAAKDLGSGRRRRCRPPDPLGPAGHTIHTTDPTATERVSAALRSLGEAGEQRSI